MCDLWVCLKEGGWVQKPVDLGVLILLNFPSLIGVLITVWLGNYMTYSIGFTTLEPWEV
jgi:hypothetical protein